MSHLEDRVGDPSAIWPELLTDYSGAVVRVASLRAEKAQHFLLGWVELYPFDMRTPRGWSAGAKPWPVPGLTDFTLGFSATPVATQVALDWYAGVAAGSVNIALTTPKPVLALARQLEPEPAMGLFAVGDDVPFSFTWHERPRVHRLVPMRRVHRVVHELSRSMPARSWLYQQLGFDPFDYEEWLGGSALLAPDPVCASLQVIPSKRDPGSGTETLSVEVTPRRAPGRTADLTSLTLHVSEKRAGAWTGIVTAAVPPDGYLTLAHPQITDKVGWALVCARRGLLRVIEPTSRIERIQFAMAISAGSATVAVPSGGRRKPAQTYEVATNISTQTSTIGEAAPYVASTRLLQLKDTRARREAAKSAPQRLFGSVPQADAAERARKKKEAQDFVSELMRSARKRLIFVDPYFGVRETRLFALQNHYPGLTLRILTGSDALGIRKDDEDQTLSQQSQGNILLEDLGNIASRLSGNVPEVRVMPGGTKPGIHDRYLVVDGAVWHCGPSFNELGDRLGVMVRLPDPMAVRVMIAKIWMHSQPLSEHMQARAAAGSDAQLG